ncbi:Asp23/Gls24 family envelope stress response protein [Corynebacterium breve]|uniref:Asp23/Gls24 family envelope stress response protein n=1 Tax=Corynebacterium breve TaxID=3049799 RepID=A0ABY8VEJ6_9CORY|nr:Asp23/Gls24 family envelope stress response protein [Corynebacterium breve]WIM68079.1 Asp23/Gls24 family envelope stress response protein [Corynebacterium breve]
MTNSTPTEQTPATSTSVVTETQSTNEVLVTDYGSTIIEDTVVSKIAGIAAREVSGVYNLGGSTARMVGAIRESLTSSSNIQQGVTVQVDNGHASAAVSVIAEYGVAIHELANAIRENIISAITRMTGLIVDKVDVTVHDIHLPSLDNEVDETTKQVEQ